MDHLNGRTIKGYELRERLGAGGFGAVYKAYQSTVGREVAIKIILPHFANHPDFIRRFETEAQFIAKLEHLHIVPLYDYWRDPDGAYLVMRWLKGGSLRDLLQAGPVALETAAQILDQIASALSAAHRANIIHRDLKPGNILLDEDSNAYLSDFGIAKDLNVQSSITDANGIVGSPDYISPEQARSELVTPATDIYCLGVVLYEILTGQHPFPNVNTVERLFKHLNEPLPEITTLPADKADEINALIQKATAKNPAHRYADALEVAAAFRRAIHTGTTNLVESLTQREQAILRLIIEGCSNKEIAQELFISVVTVKWYITHIYRKLGVRSRVQAIVRARELNLIVPGGEGYATLIDAAPIEEESSASLLDNPYKGLRAFQSADYADFFGREKLVQKLLKRLTEPGIGARFLVVIGPSGSGKSSLVKAGLIPALWRGELPGSDKWFVVEMMPGSHPIDELEVALTRISGRSAANLNEHLRRDERGLLRAASLILPEDDSELVLVIDQFEEVFTMVADEAARAHFLDLLQAAVTDIRSRIRVILTLRADYYDRPLNYPGLGELVRSHMETVLPLSAEELERAIAKPAERVGVMFEEGLVSSIVSEINYQAGALPLLQYALTELFEQRSERRLTHEAYQSIGRTTGALAKRADELYLGLDAEAQALARQMFLRMVTLGEGAEDTRRRTPRSELLALSNDPERVDEVIDVYVSYRLLTADTDPITRTPTVELAHEAIIREWERLKKWLNESRQEVRLQRQLARAAAEWYQCGQDTSFLLHGTRLETIEQWLATTTLTLTARERSFVNASLTQRTHEVQAESERKAYEVRLERRSVVFLRALVVILAVGLIVALVLSGAFFTERNRAEAALVDEQAARQASDASFLNAEAARWASSAAALLPGKQFNAETAGLLAVRSLQTHPSPEGRAALFQAVDELFTLRLFTGFVFPISASYSTDRQSVLIGNLEGLWQYGLASGELEDTTLFTRQSLFSLSPDNQLAVVIDEDGNYSFVNGDTSVMLESTHITTSSQVYPGAFSPDQTHFAMIGDNGQLYVWDTSTGYLIDRNYPNMFSGISPVSFSSDGTLLAFGNTEIHVVNVETGEVVNSFTGHSVAFRDIAFSPDDRYLLTASDDGTARLWDWQTGTDLVHYTGHIGGVTIAVFVPGGESILTGGQDGSVRLWNMLSGQEVRRMTGHTDAISALAASPDGLTALSASKDGTGRLWNIDPDQVPNQLRTDETLNAIALSDDNRTMVTSGLILSGWDVSSRTRQWSIETTSAAWDIAISADDQFVLVANGNYMDGIAIPGDLLNASDGSLIRHFAPDVTCVDFSPDSQNILYGDNTGYLHLVSWDSSVEIFSVTAHTGALATCLFSPDGTRILTGGVDAIAALHDATSGAELVRFTGHTSTVHKLAFSHDGTRIVSGGYDLFVNIWDAANGAVLQHIPMLNIPFGVGFSTSDDEVIVTTWNGSLAFISTATGETNASFAGSGSGYIEGRLSSDGSQLMTASQDGNVTFWDISLDRQLRTACLHLFQDFSSGQRFPIQYPG